MLDNKKKGNIGERIAAKHLKSKGLKILEKNYTSKIGEIDIIALDKGVIVFVEVKYRQDDAFGRPIDALTPHKVRKISQVASQYILEQRLFYSPVRFDVVEILVETNEINHVQNAFDSYLGY